MKDNKLIAEFMGYKLTKCNRGQAWERPTLSSIHDNYKLHGRLWVENDSYYKWDTSWDWLMPVVQKIGDDYYNTPFDETYAKLTEGYENIWTIEDTYKAVVEFIKQRESINQLNNL